MKSIVSGLTSGEACLTAKRTSTSGTRLQHWHDLYSRPMPGLMERELREKFVRGLYLGLLQREPDEAGLTYWSEVLTTMSPAEALEGFLECDELKSRPRQRLFVPPGHFFSPIADPSEAAAHLRQIEPQMLRDSLPDIEIDRLQMAAKWRELVPMMKSAPFGESPGNGLRYTFVNPTYSWGDGSILHAMLRLYLPNHYVEIGSGWSSVCALDTLERYHPGKCDLTFIEPYPQLLKELLGDSPTVNRVQVLDSPVQQVPTSAFEVLQSGDILFIDSTHVLRTGSDVCFELFEILPRLPSGVLVHFHDMFWPFEYPWSWAVEENRSWNELYAVRCFLANNSAWRILMFNDYLARFERRLIEETYPTFYKNSGGALRIQKK